MWLLVISDVNIVSISCNKIQVIVWKYHYTVIIKNKNTTRNPSWVYNALEGTMQEDILLYYKCAAYGGSTYGCAAVLHTAVLHTAVLLTEVLLTDVFLNIIAQIYQDWT